MRRIRRSKLRRAAWVGAAMSASFVAAELALAPISPAATVDRPSVTHSLSSAISEAKGVLTCLAEGTTGDDCGASVPIPGSPGVLVTPAAAPPPSPKPKSMPGVVLPPTVGYISSFWGDGRDHRGIDIANAEGTPITAVADGIVIDSGPAPGFGLWVRVRHDDGTITTYGHNLENLVHAGEHVRAGQEIAKIGNRGESTGPHLHFEVTAPDGQKVDPKPWLDVNSAFPPAT
jgi:murein DD-endopeptidase MepM/ murein hydrolase activator NlpD